MKPTCKVCGEPGLWCNACGKVGYCNREHQKQDWINHKKLCKSISKKSNDKKSSEMSMVTLMDELIVENDKSSIKNLEAEPPKSMPQWVDTNSVQLAILTDDELSIHDQKVSDDVISNMKKYGLSVCDNFLPEEKANKILELVQNLYKTEGRFKDGQTIISKGKTKDSDKIRGDLVTWLEGTETEYSAINYLWSKVDTVMAKCQKAIGNYRIVERTKASL